MKECILVAAILVALWCILAALSGCATCQRPATRCNGSILEVCGSNSRWQRGIDCSQTINMHTGQPEPWKCGKMFATPDTYQCLPPATFPIP